jgi:hypothetical protein
MPKLRAWIPVSGLVLLACGSERPRNPKPPEFSQAFSSVPLPPSPEFVSRSGGAGALQITLRTSASDSQVTNYYRESLSRGKWRLISDMKGRDGVTALYAEHDGPPLWVRIWPAADGPGTMVQLTGAVLEKDSAAGKAPDTSGKRRRS